MIFSPTLFSSSPLYLSALLVRGSIHQPDPSLLRSGGQDRQIPGEPQLLPDQGNVQPTRGKSFSRMIEKLRDNLPTK